MISAASELFCLNELDKEIFANRAGLSFNKYENFCSVFAEMLEVYPYKYKTLIDTAQVSERMFEYIKKNIIPSKETLLAITITCGLKIDEIHTLLRMAGYVLSKSLANDIVVLWFLHNSESLNVKKNMVLSINNELQNLNLPLLMTRPKE